MFVLGIDPGLSTTGYGIVDVRAANVKVVAAGTIRTDPAVPVARRLAELHADVVSLIVDHAPEELAIEEVFVNRNLQTATTVGRASGVVMLAAAVAGIPVFEYTPTAVKRAVTGNGRAGKVQVETMVSRRLGVPTGSAPADAYDALAIALCHAQGAPLRLAVRGGS